MPEKYLYNGKLLERSDVEDAAKQSKLDVGTYIQRAGMQIVNDNYKYNGKTMSAYDVLEGATQSKMGFDDYIQKAGMEALPDVKKKESPAVSATGGGETLPATTSAFDGSKGVTETLLEGYKNNGTTPLNRTSEDSQISELLSNIKGSPRNQTDINRVAKANAVEHPEVFDNDDPVKSLISPLAQRKKEIFDRQIQIESTGQNIVNKTIASDEVNQLNDAEFFVKQKAFPTTNSAKAWMARHPDAEKNETSKIASEIVIDNKIVTNALADNGDDIQKAAIEYYRAFDNKLGAQLRVFKEDNSEVPPELKAQLVSNFLQNRTIKELSNESQDFHNKVKEQQDNFYQNFPEAHNQKLISDIAEGRKEFGYNNWFANLPGVKSADSIADRLVESGKWSQWDKEYYDKNTRVRIAANLDEIPTPGLLETAVNSTWKGIEDVPKGIYNASGIRNMLHSEGDILSQDMSEDMSKANVPKFTGLQKWAHATGSLVGVVIPITGEAKLLEGFNLVKNAAAANKIAMVSTFYNDIEKQERANNPGNPMLAHLSALVQSGVWYKINNVLPALSKAIVGEAAPEINSVLQKLQSGEIENASAQKIIANTVMGKVKNVINKGVEAGKDVLHLANEVSTATAINGVVSGVISGGYDLDEQITNVAGTYQNMLLGGSLLSVIKVANNRDATGKMISQMADNPDYFVKQIDRISDINPEFAKKAGALKDNLFKAVKVKAALDGETSLTEKQKEQYILQSVAVDVLKNKLNQIPESEPKLREPIENQIRDAEKIKEDILSNKEEAVPVPIELTPEEATAIESVKTKNLTGTDLELQSNVLNDEASSPEQKRTALKEISDQLLATSTAEKAGSLLGKDASIAIENLGHEAPVESDALKAIIENRPLTQEEQKDWSELSMEEKRKLATENLPEITDNAEADDIVNMADANAKYLLAKMRGEDISRPIELNPKLPGDVAAEPILETSEQQVESVEKIKVYNASPRNIEDLGSRSGVTYFATDKREADEYSRMNEGEIRELEIPISDIKDEEYVVNKIKELGLKPKDEEFEVDQSMLHELIDERFENSLSKEDIKKLFDALKKEGVVAIKYTDEGLVVGKTTTSIAVIDNSYIRKITGKQKAEQSSTSETETLSNDKTNQDATKIGEESENNQQQYSDGNKSGEATQTGDSNSTKEGGEVQETVMPESTRESGPPPVDTGEAAPEGEGTGITHAQTGDIRKEFGLPEYAKEGQTVEQWDAEAEARIKNGGMDALLKYMESGGIPNHIEQRMMGKYIASLEAKAEQTMSDADITKLHDAVKLSDRIGGSDWGRAGVARKGIQLNDESLAGYFIRELESAHVDVLTDAQKTKVQKEYEDIKKANELFTQKIAELEIENQKLKAGKELKKTVDKTKKASKDFVAERKIIIDNIREKLKKARGETNVTPIPYAKELFTIAPDVAKLVKSIVEEGVTKLADVVERVYGHLKDDINEITPKDVQDLIAGVYNERKSTKSEINASLADLRTEAKLINKLEALLSGAEPTAEKKKIERNKQIKSLQDQIQEVRKNIKENNEFYAEEMPSDAKALKSLKSKYETEIKKLEDELSSGDYIQERVKTPTLENKELREKFPVLFKEALDAKDRAIELRQFREVRILQQEYADRSFKKKSWDLLLEILNVPRTIMASMDFSAPLRQGVVAVISHPSTGGKAFVEMFKMAASQKRFDRWFDDLHNDPRYDVMQKSGLSIADPHDYRLSFKEEAFMNNLAEKIPLIGGATKMPVIKDGKIQLSKDKYGGLIKGSERAYVGFLNKMRVDVFNSYADAFIAEGKTIDNSPEVYKALGSWVNNITGRGSLPSGIERMSPVLNTIFFSPRLIASRMNLLNPLYYTSLPKEVRGTAWKSMAKFIGVGLTTLAIANLMGASTEDDPRSSDFGKIKSGDTRWDIWGGFQPYVRVATQLLSKTRVQPGSGKLKEINRSDVLWSFARGKLAPVPSMVQDFLTEKTVIGQPVTVNKELESHLLPLIYSDVSKAMKDQGLKALFTVGIPATFGIGVNTYSKK